MVKVTNWDKFKLLLWKNWILQWNRKRQVLIELSLPVLFSLLLVLVRLMVEAEPKDVVKYTPIGISNLSIFKEYLTISDKRQSLMKAFLPKLSKIVGLNSAMKSPEMKLLYSPNTEPIFGEIVSEAAMSLKIPETQGFPNADELNSALVNGNFLAGVQFDTSVKYPKKLSYALRFPSELRTSTMIISMTWFTMKLFMTLDMPGPRNVNDTDGGIPVGYVREGFLPIQHAISSAYIKLASKQSSLPEVELQRYPYPGYIYDPLLLGLTNIMSLIIVLSFIYPCTHVIKNITVEKEKQLKEIMKIMGLNNWIHWAAWFVKSFIMLGISALVITILMKIQFAHNASVLTYSSFTAVLFFMLIYVMTSICFCFMLATFFSKASTATAVVGLIWFMAYLPYSFTLKNYENLGLSGKLSWSLLSNTAMAFGFKVILDLESTGEGLQWYNIFSPVSVDDSISLGAIILMMLISCVLYMIICLYVEQIFPGEYGVPKKWNFPFQKQFWTGESKHMVVENISSGDLKNRNIDGFEPEPVGKEVGLQIQDLKKKFGQKWAVKGVSMNMYKDEITVLLGHNGAGKTTTISMLTGIYPPTSGTAIINGSDIRTNIDGARTSMGICPQHNVLFDDLSVRNHLVFFSRLKGLKGADVRKEVDKYLKMIELEDKAGVPSSKLSGGMKRKLSICCALCGGTKVVLCDEPSSGMDPSARRQLWDLLQAEKSGRTVLLTTHFMDEADVLGDRIAIMSEGELKCVGTPFFLKKKFGSGYRLICVKRENCNPDDITALLRTYIPGINPESNIGAELTYSLPDSAVPQFEKMFKRLEERSDRLNLSGYGIGITSLEEVFLKMGAEKSNNGPLKEKNGDKNNGAVYPEEDLESVHSGRPFSNNMRLQKGSDLFFSQWRAMIFKKYLYTLRNKLLFLIQNFIPIFFITVTVLIAKSRGTYNALNPMTISLTQYPSAVTVLERDPSLNTLGGDAVEVKIANQYERLAESYGSAYGFESTGISNFTEYILKLGATKQVRINARYLAAATVAKDKITAWLNNQPLHTAPLTVNMVHNAMARALIDPEAEITVTNAPLPYTPETRLSQLNVGNNLGTQLATQLCFCMSFVSALYILFLIKERESRSKLLQFVSGVRVWTFWLSQLLWDMATFTLTAVIAIVVIACFQEEGYSSFIELIRYFCLLILFGLSALPLTYLISLIYSEPATGFARISIINIFLGMALFILILIMSIDVFDSKDTADTLQIFFRIFPHFCLAMGLNKLYTNSATRKACNNPLIEKIPEALRCKLVPRCCKTISYFDWNEPGIGPEVLYLIFTAFIFFLVLVIREYGFLGMVKSKCNLKKSQKPELRSDSMMDDDVTKEKQRIALMSKSDIARQNLVLDHVSKRYRGFLAVKELSMCVTENECFGLLGVNGAGKTSTFKMLTGDERISSGVAYVKGMRLDKEMNSIYKEIGYCPQFDALLDYMTGRETLKVFSLLRGIRRDHISGTSEELAKSFGFINHIEKPTGTYSGGNKRKLSTALAVLGSPSVIYLDEPTTGMDPAARRQLWDMVCRIRDSGKSVVLTSHSMEECEALCTRLAIMVNGEFKCIGSSQHLKNKFSKGLILKVKVKRKGNLERPTSQSYESAKQMNQHINVEDILKVKKFVSDAFPLAILQEEYQGILTFYIPLDSITWSKIFGIMEANRVKLNIEDYSVSQTTLEEIFLEFAKSQHEDRRPQAKKSCCSCCSCCS